MRQRIRHRISIKKTKDCEFHLRETRHNLHKGFLPSFFHEESTRASEDVLSEVVHAFVNDFNHLRPTEELEVLFIIREP